MPKLDMKTRREVMEYLRENNASPEEKRTVWQWVLLGRDIYDNPGIMRLRAECLWI